MPLSAGRFSLFDAIKAAYTKTKDSGAAGDPPDDIIKELAIDLGDAIHDYMITAQVITTVTVDPTQSGLHIPFGTGKYQSPGSGTGDGTISFESSELDTLKSDIEAALQKVSTAGAEDGADPDNIIGDLGKDLTAGIHKFALTAKVETNVDVVGGIQLLGYMTTSAPPVAVPATSSPGTGKGEGSLS